VACRALSALSSAANLVRALSNLASSSAVKLSPGFGLFSASSRRCQRPGSIVGSCSTNSR